MDIENIQALIAQGKIVTLADIDPSQSYVGIGVYQAGNRKRGSANNSYPTYVIPVSELGGTPPAPYVYITPNVLYVDDIQGNDATAQKGYPNLPYQTIDAATNAAVAGDVVYARRGSYNVGVQFKPQVVYDLGSSIVGVGYMVGANYGGGNFRVYGNAQLIVYGGLATNCANSNVYIECSYIEYYAEPVGGIITDSEITIKVKGQIKGMAQYAFLSYLDGSSTNVTVNFTADNYIFPRGVISWFNGTNPITFNLYGREMTHTGPDGFASLAWPLGDGMTMNFHVEHIIINAVGANAFFPWYGKLNVYSKITCNTDTSWIMADGGESTFFGDIEAPLGLLYVRGTGGKVNLRQANLTTGRNGYSALVNGKLTIQNGTVKATDLTVNPVISLNNAASVLVLTNTKIIADASKPPVQDMTAGLATVQAYGSNYSVGVPVAITPAPETITQFAALQ